MPVTLSEVRDDVRSHINETTPRFWSDTDLNRWINEAARDMSRRTETIQEFYTSIPVFPNVAKYSMPSDVLRVHRIEYLTPGDTQIYPIQLTTYQELDQVWGVIQTQSRSYPSFACFWGFPPKLSLQFFPVPSQGGHLNVFYYRLPVLAESDSDIVEMPEGWQDLIVLYCEYVAKRRDRDTTWQEAKQLYEERLGEMVDTTRQWHDQARTITVGTNAVPRWLYDMDY